jgi:hypothetical protein
MEYVQYQQRELPRQDHDRRDRDPHIHATITPPTSLDLQDTVKPIVSYDINLPYTELQHTKTAITYPEYLPTWEHVPGQDYIRQSPFLQVLREEEEADDQVVVEDEEEIDQYEEEDFGYVS